MTEPPATLLEERPPRQRNILSGNGTVGLVFDGAGTMDNTAEGNYIGTDPNGTAGVPNGFAGVYITASAENNHLGDVQPGAGNLISGNGTYGVFIADSGTTGNLVRGNFIGTNASGSAALANGFSGIIIAGGAQNNEIGGGIGGRNVISGNATYGILIADAGTSSNLVHGNTIGLNATGSGPVPNGGQGIALQNGATLNQIGGSGIGDSNLIAGNTLEGVVLFDSGTQQNRLSQNSIFSNHIRGITLNSGTNNDQAAPTLSSAVLGPAGNIGGTDVGGMLANSAVNATFHIEFFASPPGNDEGQFFAGSADVMTDGSGTAAFAAVHLSAAIPKDYLITATATDSNGNTSQLSPTQPVSTTGTDTDGDGIPDDWMMAHFNHIDPQAGDKSRATDDADGDGLTNGQEFFAGTDPTVANSVLRISSVTKSSADLQIGFPSVLGKTYRIDYKSGLVAGTWIPLVDGIVGTGADLQITDPGALGLANRFYRLTLEP